jgi:hypothetical protein
MYQYDDPKTPTDDNEDLDRKRTALPIRPDRPHFLF